MSTAAKCAPHGTEWCLHPDCCPEFHAVMRKPWKAPTQAQLDAQTTQDNAEMDAAQAEDDRFAHLQSTSYEKRKAAEDFAHLPPEEAARIANAREDWHTRKKAAK